MSKYKVKRTIKPQPREDPFLQWLRFQKQIVADANSYITGDKHFNPRKYTRKQVRQFMDNPVANERQLREVSQFLYVNSGAYMRLINFFASLLTFDNYIIPFSSTDKFDAPAFKRALGKVNDYLEKYNIKRELSKIMTVIMLEDVFFGIETEDKKSIMIRRLPSDYCKITHFDDGVYGFSFDMSFFDNNENKPLLKEQFPPQFTQMYNAYQNGDGMNSKWQMVDEDIAVCFKFHDNLLYNVPPLAGTFEDILYLDDSKALSYSQDLMANYRILFQKMPFKDKPTGMGDLLIDGKVAREYHNNIKATLPDNVGIITSPMEVSSIPLDRQKDKEKDNVHRAEANIYTSSGVSRAMFNDDASNSITINKSITADAAMLTRLLHQFEVFFKNRLSRFGSNSYGFKLAFLDTTVFNRDERLDQYLKTAQYGLPKSILFAALGRSANEITSLLEYENSINLVDKMRPLKSSHTDTGDEGGRPTKNEDDLSGEGKKTRAGNKNETRAK